MRANKKKHLKILICIIFSAIIVFACCASYLGDYYSADTSAIEALSFSVDTLSYTLDDNHLVFEPKNPKAGFIFYPGGKVAYDAYSPLMHSLAEKDILCVLVHMPFNLAVFDINAADGIRELYPDIESWYIGGHSLGGSMAASYVSGNADSFDGLILLGSYSTADLSRSGLDVLSVFGSEDKVLNLKKYENNKSNLPHSFTEYIIDGGCHAYFGMYGEQEGDGRATISNIEQISITADTISEFIN